MKKAINSILSILFAMFICFSLAACNEEIKYYTVNTAVWYSHYGIVYGAGEYKQNSQCTIKAVPKQDSTFMAWMKNNVVVSYDSEYTFEVSNQTSGTYVAIFTLPNLDLVSPKKVTYSCVLPDNTNVISSHLQIKIGSSYSLLTEIYNNDETNTQFEFDLEELTLALSKYQDIKCEINLSYNCRTIIDGEETQTLTSVQTTYIDIALEDEYHQDYDLNMPAGIEGTATISFDFEDFSVPVENQAE